MAMHNPPHPGEILLEDVLPELRLSVTALAAHLGVSRPHLSKVLHGRAPISANLAWRLEQAGLGTARHWLAMQAAYDLWQVSQQAHPPIARLKAVA
ncbi:HigA family addiction module antitoxin [Pseudomonas nicosulfuronedens]